MIGKQETSINELQDNTLSEINKQIGDVSFAERQDAELPPLDVSTENSVFAEQEEPIQVAGLNILKGGELVKGVLKETLQKKGKLISREIKVKKEPSAKVAEPPVVDPSLAPKSGEVAPVKQPKPEKVKVLKEEQILDVAKKRVELLEQGASPVSPAPSEKQLINGVGEGQISTVPYDNDEMRATLQAMSEKFLQEKQGTTIADLYQSAIDRGLPRVAIKNALDGLPFESSIGNYELAKNTAGLLQALDESTAYISNLFNKLENDYANFTDTDLFNLSQQMALHNSLMSTTTSAGSDISAAMNAFRRAKEVQAQLGGAEFKQFLDGVIDKDEALKLAQMYNKTNTAGKNKLIAGQKGLLTKVFDGAWYTFQSNLLTDVGTWGFNFTGAAAQNMLMIGEDFLIAGITGPVRRYVTGAQDGYYMEDVINGIGGVYNGLRNGWLGAAKVLLTGERAGFKSQGKINPLTAEKFSNTPLLATFPEFAVTPDLTNTWIGKLIDGAGFFHSHPFRALAAGDEITSTTYADIALNREASAFGRMRYNELKAAGKSDDEIKSILTQEIDEFRESQPIDIYKNVEELRSMANLSYAWDKMYTVDKVYARVESVLMSPLFKTFAPFAPTLTRVFDQAASRVPGMQIISPQFYKDVSRGGVYADRAMARVISGGIIPTMMITTGTLEGRFTGGGPTNPQLKKELENTGWQEYSVVFNKDELSDANKERLSKFLVVKEAKDKVYVSYKRLDQIGNIISSSVDFAESLAMYNGTPDDEEWQKYALATAAYFSEFTSELPGLQVVNNLINVSQGRYEDKGEKVTEMLETLAVSLGERAVMSLPYVSYAAGTQSAHIARLIDKEQRSTMPDTMAASDAQAALEKIRKDIQSRIPLLRGDLEMELDYLGRPTVNRGDFTELWLNGLPFVKAKQTYRNEADEVLVANKYGISKPSTKWDGVKLNDIQYNRFKKLYGQEIQLPITVMEKGKNGEVNFPLKMMNLEKAIPAKLKAIDEINQQYGLPKMMLSERQAEIEKLVNEYRSAAKRAMLGDMQEGDEYVHYQLVKNGDSFAVVKKAAEFPDLASKIDEYKAWEKNKPVGKPLIPQ